jgi:prophage endopeptidase
MIPRSVYVAIVIVLVLLGIYRYGHHKGWVERDTEMQLEIAKKNEESRAKEQQLSKQLNENASKLQEANNAIDQKQSALDRAIRAGKLRLPTAGCVQASSSPAPAGGNSDQAGSESDRETLAAIAAIVAQGDRNTQQLNACIDAYEQVRNMINGQR